MRKLLLPGFALAATAVLSSFAAAGPAFAATPTLAVSCATTPDHTCTLRGASFTPSGQVQVTSFAGATELGSTTVTATAGTESCITVNTKPRCITIGAGDITATLRDTQLGCNVTAPGTITARDERTGATASTPVTWTGPCDTTTTTTLTLPSTVDTGWTSAPNPARVTANGTALTVGTVTITVNGTPFCSYTAGTTSGCRLTGLPAGTDSVVASYSGSAPYQASSASESVRVLAVQPSGSTTSANWSGYVATGGPYTSVSGTWTVPEANCGFLELAEESSWVGLDGVGNKTVEQTGTSSNCILGVASYNAWWEMFPGAEVKLGSSYPVLAGDDMTGKVTSTGTPGQYTLTLADDTRGWTYTTTQTLAGATGATAEWITEQSQADVLDSDYGLTNYGTEDFYDSTATGPDGVDTPIWDHPNLAVTLERGTLVKSTPGPLSNDGMDFETTWHAG